MHKISRRKFGLLAAAPLLGLGLVPAFAPTATAQTYPTRPVRLIVPYPAGGGTDIIGRVAAEGLSEGLGQQVFVDNRPGAGGSIGAAQAAKLEADGYTLLMAALTSHAINMTLQPNPGFDLRRSFAPVSMVGAMGLALVVHPSVPVKTVAELVALAKAEPEKLSFASAGIGSPQHLAAEMFMAMSGTKLVHVPYRGAGPAIADVLGGHVPVFFDTIPGTLSHIKSGKLRVLAVTTPTESEFLPGVPALASLGFPGYSVSPKFGILAPAGTPEPIIARLSETVGKFLKSPKMIETMQAQSISITPGGPAETARVIEQEIALWEKVIKEAGVKLEEKK
jgi:tripartite-type tricarboxylate transporter receptor subunit TctC